MTRPTVLSIPHSGTRSLLRCIYGDDYDKKNPHAPSLTVCGGKIFVTEPRKVMHVAQRNHRSLQNSLHSIMGIPSGGKIISPLRNPKEMWKSWAVRYNNNGLNETKNSCRPFPTRRGSGPKEYVHHWEMAADAGMHPLDLFEEQWRCLSEFDEEYEIFYVPVDLECTEERIIELSAIFGRKLSFDKNERIGHAPGNYETDYPGPDWDYIYSLPFVSKFY